MLLRIHGLALIVFLVITGCTTTAPQSPPSPPVPVSTPKMDCQVVVQALYGHYEGECQNNKAHGRGKAVGQDMYKGEFANGSPHGKGIYTWADGAYFEGQFKTGKPQVPHVGCYVADQRLRGTHSGECRGGKAYGYGKAQGIDIYEGQFLDGILNGQGTYVWHNGDRYIGKFRDGKAYGRGVVQYIDGYEEICEEASNPETCK